MFHKNTGVRNTLYTPFKFFHKKFAENELPVYLERYHDIGLFLPSCMVINSTEASKSANLV